MNETFYSLPVIVMTRNDGLYLKKCIESILDTVCIPITIYIVDNDSDSILHLDIVSSLNEQFDNVHVVRNRKNLWVLGLNKTLREIKRKHASDYFFLTDADIDFYNCNTPCKCWLSYLVDKMDSNVVVGKLGFSLDWNYISKEPFFSEIYSQERSLYTEDRKIGDLFIAQVDTTACIFRWDWSMESSSFFYPDHMRYLRPELYSCRTPRDILVTHLGWHTYHKGSIPKKQINDKVVCFTIMGASLKSEYINQASLIARCFHRFFQKPFLYFWILRRYFFLFKYILLKGRRAFDGQI